MSITANNCTNPINVIRGTDGVLKYITYSM